MRRSHIAQAFVGSLLLVMATGFPLQALAQPADPDPGQDPAAGKTENKSEGAADAGATESATPPGSSAEPETIVVTAQKREEALQDVPISISVVGGDRLATLEFNEATDLQYLVPGLVPATQTGPRAFGFFIRGIGTNTFSSETIEPSTAYVVDGVVMGQGGAALTDLPDIERIEVLRGPQSTLFGKNASAGVINITTRRPSEKYEFIGSASAAGPDDDRRISAYVSGPMTKELRFSLSARRNLRDGYIENAFDDRKFNDRDDHGFRGRLEWQPSSALRANLIADYWESSTNCCIWTIERFASPGFPFEQPSIEALGRNPGRGNLQQNINGDVFADIENYGTSLQFDYEFAGGFTLTSISASRGFKTKDGLDSDSSPVDFLDINFGDHDQDQVSQELRIASPVGGFVDYVAGLYYFRSEVDSFTRQIFPGLRAILPFFDRIAFVDAETRNAAAFGQANLHLMEALTLTLGARYIDEHQKVSKDRTDPFTNLTDSADANDTEEEVTWRVALQYDFTRDIMAFASATRGFKGGGFDTNVGIQPLPAVGPEEPTSYEVGVRTAWPAAGLTLNLTLFDADIDGYQTASRDPVSLTFPLTNGDADTRGAELELNWRPLRDTELYFISGVAYTDAEWGTFTGAPCYGGQVADTGCVGGVQDLTGEDLPFAPEWSVNVAVDYARPVAEHLKVSGTVALSYRSEQVIGFPNGPDQAEPGYSLINASLGVGGIDDRWRLALFGKNLTNEDFRSFSFNISNGTVNQFRVHESQRIIGVALDVAFD